MIERRSFLQTLGMLFPAGALAGSFGNLEAQPLTLAPPDQNSSWFQPVEYKAAVISTRVNPDTWPELIAQAEHRLREAMEVQFFGPRSMQLDLFRPNVDYAHFDGLEKFVKGGM